MGDLNGDSSVAYTMLVAVNILTKVNITSIKVPEVVELNTPTTLDCEISVTDERFTLQWLHNGELVYEWSPHAQPAVFGELVGMLDLDYRPSADPLQCGRALRIVSPTPELSGNYTCLLSDGEHQHNRTAHMLVYSPEEELSLRRVRGDNNSLEVLCVARRVYPRPLLVLESNHIMMAQSMRAWRSGRGGGAAYDAEARGALRGRRRARCRLLLPPAGYEAVRDLPPEKSENSSVPTAGRLSSHVSTLAILTMFIARFLLLK